MSSFRRPFLVLFGAALVAPPAAIAQTRTTVDGARRSSNTQHSAAPTAGTGDHAIPAHAHDRAPSVPRDHESTVVPDESPHAAPARDTPTASLGTRTRNEQPRETSSRRRNADDTHRADTAPAAPTPRVMQVLTVRGTPPPLPPCLRAPVEVRRVNGHASWTGALTDCEGHPTLHGLAAISALASPTHFDALPDLEPIVREIRRVAPAVGWTVVDEHPRRAPRTPCPPGQEQVVAQPSPAPSDSHDAHDPPSQRTARTRDRSHAARTSCRTIEVDRDPHTQDPMVVLENRVRIVNPRLLTMLDEVTRHFAGHRVEMISGFRPSNDPRAGSRHAHARAIDYRLAGISREALRDFAYTLPLAGVGYYPNSVFIHMDVRDRDEGSARWTDYASHGESARYGHWPPRDEDVARETDFLVQQAGHALDALRESENAGDETPAATAPAATSEPAPAAPSSPAP